MILGSELATQTCYHEPMSSRAPLACTMLLVGFLASAPAFAQGEAFSQRFDAVLSQHGVVGGAVAIVHIQEPGTQLFFGKARTATHKPVDGKTSYNWASITKTMTAIAILQL